jgi:hypothetical protein
LLSPLRAKVSRINVLGSCALLRRGRAGASPRRVSLRVARVLGSQYANRTVFANRHNWRCGATTIRR